jgi:hypothetical protein
VEENMRKIKGKEMHEKGSSYDVAHGAQPVMSTSKAIFEGVNMEPLEETMVDNITKVRQSN